MTEFFDIVDRNDKVIGKAARKECHSNPKLIHRAVNIFVLNSENQLLLQRRSGKADTDPLKWSVLFGEHNKLGEDYGSAAKRGLKEELKLEGKMERFSRIFWKGKIQTEFNVNYVFIFNGDINKIKFDKSEIEEIKFADIEKVKEMLKNKKNEFVDYGKCMFEELLKNMGDLNCIQRR